MVEVAIVAFRAAMGEMNDEELNALAKSFERPVAKKAAESATEAVSPPETESAEAVAETAKAQSEPAEAGEAL
jgi:Sec-independent protein translocase protein TatA